MHPDYTPRDIARLDRRTDFNGPVPAHRPELGNCWPYIGQPSQEYPQFKAWYRTRQKVNAHVAAYEIRVLNGAQIPDGMFVCHHCDFGRCTRPDHLFVGTPADNMHDMIDKARQNFPGTKTPARGERNGAYLHPEKVNRGESHGMHILTEAQVLDIRRRYRPRKVTQARLALEYGVSIHTIHSVIGRVHWKHLT